MKINSTGNGMGLYITKQLTGLLSSCSEAENFAMESAAGRGTQVTWRVSANVEQPCGAAEQVQSLGQYVFKARRLRRCGCVRVLVVDDDSFNVLSLQQMLRRLHFESLRAFNGLEALEQLALYYLNFACAACQGISDDRTFAGVHGLPNAANGRRRVREEDEGVREGQAAPGREHRRLHGLQLGRGQAGLPRGGHERLREQAAVPRGDSANLGGAH